MSHQILNSMTLGALLLIQFTIFLISRWPVGIMPFFTIGLDSERSRNHYCFIIGKQMKTTHYTWFGSSTILQDYQEHLSTSCNQMQEQDINIVILYLLKSWFIIWKTKKHTTNYYIYVNMKTTHHFFAANSHHNSPLGFIQSFVPSLGTSATSPTIHPSTMPQGQRCRKVWKRRTNQTPGRSLPSVCLGKEINQDWLG